MSLEQSRHTTALSESAGYRYLAFGALYIVQGLPAGLFIAAIPAWLAQQGRGTAELGGVIALVTLPWSLKLIWGPVLDRYGYLPMGRRRPWIIVAQVGVIMSFVLLSLIPEPSANLQLLSLLGCTLNVFASLQDVAIDGMAIDVLPAAQRGRANGVMYGGALAGFSLASAGGAILLNQYGFHVMALTGAGLVGVILLIPLFLRERPGERLLPWTSGETSAEVQEAQVGQWRTVVGGVLRAVILPASLAMIVFAFLGRIPDGVVRVILPVLAVQELGWTNTEYSQLMALYGVVSAVGSLMIGATVVDRFGAVRTIVIATLFGTVVGALFSVVSHLWTIRPVFIGFLLVSAVLNGAIVVAFLSLCMTLCWRRVAATQFALYMAVINHLGIAAGSAVTGWVDRLLDYPQIFLVRAVIEAALLTLLVFVNLASHEGRIADLDAAYVAEG